MSVSGLAVFDEVEDADLWIGFALDKFRRSVDVLGPDGASHEGVGYWEYGVEYLLKFMHLARELLGADLYQHDAVALEETWVCELPFDQLETLCSFMPRLQRRILMLLGQKIRRANTAIVLSLMSIRTGAGARAGR